MNQFTDLFSRATELVAAEYFILPIHDGPSTYRERVYCYELYHQMRTLWPPQSPYLLNGEIDKSGHPYFNKGEEPKPDFLIHEPGSGNNYCVVEVKSCLARRTGIRKDLTTLECFTTRIGYRRAIYLFYGLAETDLMTAIAPHLAAARAHIEVWLHPEAGRRAYRVSLGRQ